MTGRLVKRNGIYHMVISYISPTGENKQKWKSTKLPIRGNQRKAEQRLREFEKEFTKEFSPLSESLSFSELCTRWLNKKESEVRWNTYSTYSDAIRVHIEPYFHNLGKYIRKLKASDLDAYFINKVKEGIAPSTLKKHYSILKAMLDYAVNILAIITTNEILKIKPPKEVKRIPNFYTHEELQRLLELVKGEHIESAVYLSTIYGIRRSEVCGLRWSSIDFNERRLIIEHTAVRHGSKIYYGSVTKTDSSIRSFPLTDSIYLYLKELLHHQNEMKKLYGQDYIVNDYVCKWDDGKPLDPDYVTQRFRTFLKSTDLPLIRFHDLRHSSASLLINNGFSLREIQEWLGHHSIRSSEIYSHLLPDTNTKMADRVELLLSSNNDTIEEVDENHL